MRPAKFYTVNRGEVVYLCPVHSKTYRGDRMPKPILEIMELPIGKIKVPLGYGKPLEFRVAKIIKAISEGKAISPVVVMRKDDYYEIFDGVHRFEAYKRLGYKNIPVEILQ